MKSAFFQAVALWSRPEVGEATSRSWALTWWVLLDLTSERWCFFGFKHQNCWRNRMVVSLCENVDLPSEYHGFTVLFHGILRWICSHAQSYAISLIYVDRTFAEWLNMEHVHTIKWPSDSETHDNKPGHDFGPTKSQGEVMGWNDEMGYNGITWYGWHVTMWIYQQRILF